MVRRLMPAFLACWLSIGIASLGVARDDDVEPGPTIVNKGGVEIDLQSNGRIVADDVIQNGRRHPG